MDKCVFFNVEVGAFDVSSGALVILLVILMLLFLLLYTYYNICFKDHFCFLMILIPLVILAFICVLANVLFSFVSVVKVVYRDFSMWKAENIDCTSPAFYSAFTYVTFEFVLIALLIIAICVFFFVCK